MFWYSSDDAIALRMSKEQKVWIFTVLAAHRAMSCLLNHSQPIQIGQDDTLSRSIERFYTLGVFPDWWKLAFASKPLGKNIGI